MCVQNHSYSLLALLEGIANCFLTAILSGKYCPFAFYLHIALTLAGISYLCVVMQEPQNSLTLDKMDRWKSSQVILALLFTTSVHGKGLFSGVPCSRSYRCATESSNLIAEISNVSLEEECQAACAVFSNCVSYTWASERAHELDIEPFLCQLFTSCERRYDALRRVSSGKRRFSSSASLCTE